MFSELTLLQATPALLFLAGTIVGSFLNALEYRIGHQLPIAWGDAGAERSHCPHCSATLQAGDLVPLLSFMLLRGRCRYCKQNISWQYPVVELATGALFTVLAVVLGPTIELVLAAALTAVLVGLFLTDIRYQLLPDLITIPGIVIAIALGAVAGLTPLSVLIGALVGGGFFALQYAASKGRWVGGGDIRLGVLAGAALGWPHILVMLFIAYVGGSIIALALIATKRVQWKSRIPFGTFLTVATFVTLLWGQQLLDWYISILS